MCVVYLIVVLSHHFPVVLSVGGPGPVIDIVVEAKITKTWLLVGSTVHFFPRHGSLRGIQIDPHKPDLVNVGMDLEEAVLAAVEFLQIIKLWSLGQVAVQVVRPAFGTRVNSNENNRVAWKENLP